MTAPAEDRGPLADLAAALEIADPDQRLREVGAHLRSLAMFDTDAVTEARARRMVTSARIGMNAADVNAIMREARTDRAEARGRAAAALGVVGEDQADDDGPRLPDGAIEIDGAAPVLYVPGDGSAGSGAAYELRGKSVRRMLSWAPLVESVLEALADDGAVIERFYVIRACGCSVAVSETELRDGAPWRVLPVTGTGTRRAREILADIVQHQAAALTPSPALVRTGWHLGADGERFYVFADGRAHDGRAVYLYGSQQRAKLAAAAAPVPAVAAEDMITALLEIAEHGGPAALLMIGLELRALTQSQHAAPGGCLVSAPYGAGKSGVAWNGRTMLIARKDRAGAWPPLPSAPFSVTPTRIELECDFEADMMNLIDDAALNSASSRAEESQVVKILEHVFRSAFNATEPRPRSDRTMLPQTARYIRGIPVATLQAIPPAAQGSLQRRVLLIRLSRDEYDAVWYEKNGAALIAPLRTLAEWVVIPRLAARGDGLPAYVAGLDAEALELLRPHLDAVLPGWESDPVTRISGPARIAAAYLGGLLMAADMLELSREMLTATVLPWLAEQLARQAAGMADDAAADEPGEALAEILRAALGNDKAAHIRSAETDRPCPALEGFTEQEQGLREVGERNGALIYEPRGPLAIYVVGDELGIKSENLHALVKRADDPRLPAKSVKGLLSHLLEHRVILPSGQRGSVAPRVVKINGASRRLVMLRGDFLANTAIEAGPDFPVTAVTAVTEQLSEGALPVTVPVTASVTGQPDIPVTAPGMSDLMSGIGSAPTTAQRVAPPSPVTAARPAEDQADAAEAPAEGLADGAEVLRVTCRGCGEIMAKWLLERGAEYHVTCGPDESFAQFAVSLGEPVAAPAAPIQDMLSEAKPAALAPVIPLRRERELAHVVIGADGRGYAPGGEVLPLPRSLADVHHVGDLAALALELGAARLYVTRAARELLGLPAVLADQADGSPVPHMFTEAADPAQWDVWPAGGLSAWMQIFRQPKERHEGAAVVFPEWGDKMTDLAELDGRPVTAPELSAALDHVWRATTHHGEGRGGVAFHRSPATTYGRLLERAASSSKRGVPAAVTMPPPYDFSIKRPRGAPPLLIPGDHDAPPAEVPPGWILAHLDVRRCYAAAALNTDFGIGEPVHSKPGELTKAPGAHLVMCRADAAVIHPALTPWFPAAGRRRDVLAWLDTHAARWLAERGVPIEVLESWTWSDKWRPFESINTRLLEARTRLAADGSRPARAAEQIVKAMANAFTGRLVADYDGARPADDWTLRPDWWATVKTQPEVRKQRNLLPMIDAGIVVLHNRRIDTVYVAAPSREALESAPGTGGRPAVAEANGKFRIEAIAEVTPELSAILADPKAPAHTRFAAITAALGEQGK